MLQSPKRCVFKDRLKESKESPGCRSPGGRSFHSRGPAAEKLLSPNLLCVRGTSSFRMSLEWDLSGRRPASDRRWQLSARYAGAAPASSDWCTSPAILNATRWWPSSLGTSHTAPFPFLSRKRRGVLGSSFRAVLLWRSLSSRLGRNWNVRAFISHTAHGFLLPVDRRSTISAVDCSIAFKFGTEFHHVTGDTLQMFKVKGQRSRSQRKVIAAKTLQYGNA